MIANADSITVTIQILSSPEIYQYAFANTNHYAQTKNNHHPSQFSKKNINIFLLFVLTLHTGRNFGIYLDVTYPRLV